MFGIPVYLHWSVYLALAICIPLSFIAGIEVFFMLFALLTLISFHEIGHGVIANIMNFKIYKINLSIAIGHCFYEFPYYKHEDIYISWGGVLGQLVLFLPTLLIFLWQGNSSFGPINVLILFFIILNLLFIIINLLPIRGLDGYLAWQIIPHYYNLLLNKKKTNNHSSNPKNIKKSAAEITEDIIRDLKNKI